MALTGPFGFSANLLKMPDIRICSAFAASFARILAIHVKHNCGGPPETLGFLAPPPATEVNGLGKIKVNPALTLR